MVVEDELHNERQGIRAGGKERPASEGDFGKLRSGR